MQQIFGNFPELTDEHEYLLIGFSPSSVPLQRRWRNNGLSADFLADYVATFFPAARAAGEDAELREELKSAVGYVANELLENAMKFSDDSVNYPVSVALQLHSDRLIFKVGNSVRPRELPRFQAFIRELLHNEPAELYVRQLEKNAEDASGQHSGMGYLTMLHDYDAKLGWKFETPGGVSQITTVTTVVQLMIR